jgi:hypothetical protein
MISAHKSSPHFFTVSNLSYAALTGSLLAYLVVFLGSFSASTKAEAQAAPKALASGGYICPASITLLGGGKIKADIPLPLPARVGIAGTADFGPVAGKSGKWISKGKYAGTNVTLVYTDSQGAEVCGCDYDANGDLVEVADFLGLQTPLIISSVPSIFIYFNLFGAPDGVAFLDIERSGSSTGPFAQIGTLTYIGEGSYEANDNDPILTGMGDVGDNYYRIAAKNSAGEVLGYSAVLKAVPL